MTEEQEPIPNHDGLVQDVQEEFQLVRVFDHAFDVVGETTVGLHKIEELSVNE